MRSYSDMPTIKARAFWFAWEILPDIGFNASNGTVSWRSQKFKNRGLTDLILNDDKIYFGDFEGYIHELDSETGMITGLTKTNLESISQIGIFSNKLFAQDIDGTISGFSLK